MISFLSGTILKKGNGWVILRAGDVGYKVFVNSALYADLNFGQPVEIYTHQYVREDALELYGFRNMDELGLFEMLISISGIGPKTALGVLAVGSAADVRESIARGDSGLLTKVSGIGKKTAERVVLELRDKVGHIDIISAAPALESGSVAASADEIDALVALGYSLSEARDALRAVDPKIVDSGERIRAALRRMGKGA